MSYFLPVPFTRVNDRWFTAISPESLDARVSHELIQGPFLSDYQLDFYRNFCVDLVAETVYDYPYPCITEKLLRPISCKRFFIVIGPAKVLHLLRSKGFDTFDDIIDGSYDDETDPKKRWLMLEEVIQKTVKMPLDDLKQALIANEHRLDRNLDLLKNLERTEIEKLRNV